MGASPSLTLLLQPRSRQSLFAIIDGQNSLQLVFQQQVVNPQGRARLSLFGLLCLAVNLEQALYISIFLLSHQPSLLLRPRQALGPGQQGAPAIPLAAEASPANTLGRQRLPAPLTGLRSFPRCKEPLRVRNAGTSAKHLNGPSTQADTQTKSDLFVL